MRRLRLLITISISCCLPQSLPWHAALAQQNPSRAKPLLFTHEFRGEIFGNTRTIRVVVPQGYDAAGNRTRCYPVLYLNDGQNLFDASTSLFNPVEWQVDETVARLVAQQKIPPLIVVGVDNAGKRNRPSEYLPYPDEYLRPAVPSPRGREYPAFLIDEVIPFINRAYRTQTGPESTGIGGSSYGAAAALYTVMSRPGVFGRLLLESPSLYISNGRLVKDSAGARQWPARVYVAIGTKETGDAEGDREAVAIVERFGENLRRAGLDETRLLVVIDEGGTHREDVWGSRLARALEFLYGG